MDSAAIAAMAKMMARLPTSTQEHLVEHMREYLVALEDEALWDEQFASSQAELVDAAKRARKAVEAGQGNPMDFERL